MKRSNLNVAAERTVHGLRDRLDAQGMKVVSETDG